MTTAIYSPIEIAQWWFNRGFFLLPVQPNSKRNVSGFGFHQGMIRTIGRFCVWFDDVPEFNLAVCGTEASLILDFDDPDRYAFWANKFPGEAETYTERTPRGGYHVFAHVNNVMGEFWNSVSLVQGVELKRVVLVHPSVIDGATYQRGKGDILHMNAGIVLSPLSKSPIIRQTPRPIQQGAGRLQKIKTAFHCLDVIQSAKPKTRIYKSSHRFMTLCCPFHDDKDPSFWILTDRNLWGCHACNVRGDVINLYARLHGITNSEAIREMGKSL